MAIDKNEILNIFNMLNNANIEYVLLRNIDNELPEHFEAKKDIDILVKAESKNKFKKVIKEAGYKQVRHPWDFGKNFVFLYAMDRLEFFTKDSINLDICYQLCCRSVNCGEWMPVDQLINDSVWENRRKNSEWGWYELCPEDELLHLLTRCVFDKKVFNNGYRKRIEELMQKVNREEVYRRLEVVFFKFSDRMLDMIEEKQYDDILDSYITFTDY